jgi:hypothetical protein
MWLTLGETALRTPFLNLLIWRDLIENLGTTLVA